MRSERASRTACAALRGTKGANGALEPGLCGDGFKGGVGGGEPGDRHAERGAGHVVETDVVAEPDGAGLPAVLPADPHLELGSRGAAVGDRHADELPYA